jgi:hypothetical protein
VRKASEHRRFDSLSAILGAVVASIIAAGAGIVGPLSLQGRQDRRDDRRENVAARGAARLLFGELLDAQEQMVILANDRILRRFDPSYPISLPPEDMRLIYSKLAGEDWGSVQAALANVAALQTFVNTQIDRGRKRLTRGEACFARIDAKSIRVAAGGLADLADAPGRDTAPQTPWCTPKPGPIPRALRPRR